MIVEFGLLRLWLDGWPDEKRKMHLKILVQLYLNYRIWTG